MECLAAKTLFLFLILFLFGLLEPKNRGKNKNKSLLHALSPQAAILERQVFGSGRKLGRVII